VWYKLIEAESGIRQKIGTNKWVYGSGTEQRLEEFEGTE
jgi:hypothetical protein